MRPLKAHVTHAKKIDAAAIPSAHGDGSNEGEKEHRLSEIM